MRNSHNQLVPKLAIIAVTVLIIAGISFASDAAAQAENIQQSQPLTFSALQTTPEPDEPAMDHSTIKILEGPFDSPQQVTSTCLSCHPNAAEEIMGTVHWTWEITNEKTGQMLGKRNLINNFCISIESNEPRCTSCHISYGWEDNTFDFEAKENIDCLVCHDTTGTYQKFPTGAGYPATTDTEFPAGSGNIFSAPDYAYIAQNIGQTSRETCGACHFYGGGGDYVKHGDLDSSLIDPAFEIDVHMSADGADFDCTTCHMTEDHKIAGSRYLEAPEDWQGCESCHTTEPHEIASLNHHTEKVSCQTCHIPEFARGGLPTKMTWDWSTAGQLGANGKPLVTKNDDGQVIYDGKKGNFTYESNVIPDYVWYNGNVSYTLTGEEIDPSQPVHINDFLGDKDDPTAKIYPVKTFTAVQPYDSGNNTLAIPHLFGSDDAAYWKSFDWDASIAAGMDYAGLNYSGQYDFVESIMYWPTTHMVAPISEALECHECHTAENGRVDFAALGFSEADVERLTNFPPGTNFYDNAPISNTEPEDCQGCHPTEYELWADGTHADKSVGCVACHQLEQEGTHPEVAFTMVKGAETCGACHVNSYRDWELSLHSEYNVTCVTCHNPHSQSQMTIGDYHLACETCHQHNRDEINHSTHAAAGLSCISCHQNTNRDTGHTYIVQSDTCLDCHAESIHTSNMLVNGETVETMGTEVANMEEAETDQPQSNKINITIWAGAFFAIVIGVGFTLLFNGRINGKEETE